MSSQTSTSFMPEKLRILSGSALKMLAMAIMLIDHTASFLLRHYPPAIAPWFQIGSTTYSLYRVMRDVGRAAFPIFCFLLVEGFLHTHNRFKYGRNLLIFACISEIPWNFAQNGTLLYPDKQNVFSPYFWDILHSAWSNALKKMLPACHALLSCCMLALYFSDQSLLFFSKNGLRNMYNAGVYSVGISPGYLCFGLEFRTAK